MGSLHWARSFGQPWSAAGSLWGWAVSRLHLNWTTRLIHQDEEMVVLTHSDELDRTYGEDSGPTFDRTTNRSPSSHSSSLSEPDTSAPHRTGPGSILWHNSPPTFKETRATVISTGPGSITITSAVSTTQESLWFKNTTSYGKAKRPSEIVLERTGGSSEENLSFTQKKKSNENSSNGMEVQDKGNGQEIEERTSQFMVRLGEERERRSFSADTTGLNPSPTITAWEAGWNVTNAIQGIFVLGLPFALVHSGYLGLVLMVLSAWVCNYTGTILVACLYEDQQSGGAKVRVRNSYQDIVEACCKGLWPSWPGLAGWIINVAQVIELLMTCTLYLVVSTSLLSNSMSGLAVPRSVCSLVSVICLLPCLLLTDLRPVSTLSLLCSLAHILISLMVMLYCLSLASTWSWSTLSLSADPEEFLVSVGVIIFSYTSQIFLPPLEGSMEDRGQFGSMLAWTHGAACVMKTLFSLLAVLTWGTKTSEVITDNLPSELRPPVNLCLLAKALLSYPLPFYSAAEILQSCLVTDSAASSCCKHGGGRVSGSALLLRGSLLMTSYLLALLVPRFSLLMGLTGSVTGSAMTLILPCLFHLRLCWARLSLGDRLIDVGILILGVICSASGVICSVKRLVEGL